jgi:hypothetical protein
LFVAVPVLFVAWACLLFLVPRVLYRPVPGLLVTDGRAAAPNADASARPRVSYRYTVDGLGYVDSRPAEELLRVRARDAAEEWHSDRQHRPNTVTVFVSRFDPRRSKLDRLGRVVPVVLLFAILVPAVALFQRWFRDPAPKPPAISERETVLATAAAILLLTGSMAGVIISTIRERREYSTVSGIVREVAVLPTTTDKGRLRFTPGVRYTYEVAGRTYQGSRFSNATIALETEAEAREHLLPFTPGRTVAVYVARTHPQRSFVYKADRSLRWATVLLVCGALGGVWYVPRAWRALRRGHSG